MIPLIIRKQDDAFVMIKQHDHGEISKKLYEQLYDRFLPKTYRSSIMYAIQQHDCGWIPFDKTPFWNDQSHTPYDFTDFPTSPKVVLYEHGINRIEEKDYYAALLCSEHFTRFMKNDPDRVALQFVDRELIRQKRLKAELAVNEATFQKHYELLQFFDTLSLYICLNEPGVSKNKEHVFFKEGIKLPQLFARNRTLIPKWASEQDVELNYRLFSKDISLTLKQKVVSNEEIKKFGLQAAYSSAAVQKIPLRILNGIKQ